MILALEGPDNCGKTTLFNALRGKLDAVFVELPPATREVFENVGACVRLYLAVFAAMYSPEKLYAVDRFPSITDRVYSELYGRQSACAAEFSLNSDLRVVYLDVPCDILKLRGSDELFDFDDTESLCAIYRTVLKNYEHVVLDGTKPVTVLVDEVTEWMLQCATRSPVEV